MRKLRDAAKAETRAALVDAAMAEFAERGLDAPSLDAICARAGYTRGAFYVHFADREALVDAVMERVIGAWLEAIVATADPANDLARTVERFTTSFEALLPRVRGDEPATDPLVASARRFHLLLEACTRHESVQRRFSAMILGGTARIADAIRAGQAAGTLREDADPDQSARLLVTLVLGLLSSVEVGLPVDPAGIRAVVLGLTAAPILTWKTP